MTWPRHPDAPKVNRFRVFAVWLRRFRLVRFIRHLLGWDRFDDFILYGVYNSAFARGTDKEAWPNWTGPLTVEAGAVTAEMVGDQDGPYHGWRMLDDGREQRLSADGWEDIPD